jgi:hypothetical protein
MGVDLVVARKYSTNGTSVLAPRLEFLPERMEKHDPLGFGRRYERIVGAQKGDQQQYSSPQRPRHEDPPTLN